MNDAITCSFVRFEELARCSRPAPLCRLCGAAPPPADVIVRSTSLSGVSGRNFRAKRFQGHSLAIDW